MIGQNLAHYQILEKIGSGGMGDVYLADDTKLDRKIALKVLPPHLAEDEERRSRFQREARAIAALDHPNIVQVFSVEETDGTHFITMQLVRGKTLTELLPKNGFPLKEFFDVAVPLVDAVAAAHREGITHRDLKPDNVMVTDDGRVKVLDFGLARPQAPLPTEPDSESPTELKTREGVLLGTLHYMSPEQVEGKAIDARSDTFSLGVVLYEMLSGRRPFDGDTLPSILSSILKDDAPPLPPEIPKELSRIVGKCLVKDPDRRYQSSRDVYLDLEEVQRELDSGALEPVASATRLLPRGRALVAGTAVAIASALLGYWLGTGDVVDPELEAMRLTNPIQVTSAVGVEDHPSWSPDGRTLVYESNQTGNWDIWVAQVATGDAANRTADHPGDDRVPSWSPDGNRIAFWSDRDSGGYYTMPALGGAPRKVATTADVYTGDSGHRPVWLADGEKLAVWTTSTSVEIVSLRSGETTSIEVPRAFELSASPDDRFLAFATDAPTAEVTQLWIERIADGQRFALTDGLSRSRGPSFSADGRTLFYVSNRGGSMDLWRQQLNEEGEPIGSAQPISSGLGIRSVASFSTDGSRLAYSRGRFRVANVWRVPMLRDRPATWSDAEQLTFDQAFAEFVEVSPDGTELLVTSDRAGNPDLWRMSSEGGAMTPVTADPTPDWKGRFSPDGTQIAFYSYRTGAREVWLTPTDGGRARQLTTEGGYSPSWSPDGEEIAFAGAGFQGVYAVPAAGGEPRQIVEHGFTLPLPSWSPNGQWIAFTTSEGLWRVRPNGDDLESLSSMPELSEVQWSSDSTTLFFTGRDDNVWSLSLDDGVERPLTDLSGKRGTLGISIATDGELLYFTWEEDLGDIWVMDVVTDEDS